MDKLQKLKQSLGEKECINVILNIIRTCMVC